MKVFLLNIAVNADPDDFGFSEVSAFSRAAAAGESKNFYRSQMACFKLNS
jgi:hypothetical protein